MSVIIIEEFEPMMSIVQYVKKSEYRERQYFFSTRFTTIFGTTIYISDDFFIIIPNIYLSSTMFI